MICVFLQSHSMRGERKIKHRQVKNGCSRLWMDCHRNPSAPVVLAERSFLWHACLLHNRTWRILGFHMMQVCLLLVLNPVYKQPYVVWTCSLYAWRNGKFESRQYIVPSSRAGKQRETCKRYTGKKPKCDSHLLVLVIIYTFELMHGVWEYGGGSHMNDPGGKVTRYHPKASSDTEMQLHIPFISWISVQQLQQTYGFDEEAASIFFFKGGLGSCDTRNNLSIRKVHWRPLQHNLVLNVTTKIAFAWSEVKWCTMNQIFIYFVGLLFWLPLPHILSHNV